MRPARGILVGWIGCSLLIAGCEQVKSAPLAKETTDVVVSLPIVAEVTDYEEFTGHTDAILSVEIKSQVTGYLMKKNFLDGAEAHKGDVLYEIDERPFRAAYDGALWSVKQAEVHLQRLDADFKRASNLFQGGNIGRQEFDLISSNYAEARAALDGAKATLQTAEVNLGYTKIQSPMDGQLSRTLVDPGNLVRQNTTILNDIVQADKLYVYFDVNEEGMQRVSDLIKVGRVDAQNGQEYPIEVGTSVDQDRHDAAVGRLRDLADQKKTPTEEDKQIPGEFPYKGLVNFSENTLDAATGTLRIRGIIDNPAPYILSPGLFVRVRLPYGKPHSVVLINETAIGSDQGRNFVYVIDADDEVVYRPVVTGSTFNGLRAIREGLKADERIIIDSEGIRRVRPGARVAPKLVATKGNPLKSP